MILLNGVVRAIAQRFLPSKVFIAQQRENYWPRKSAHSIWFQAVQKTCDNFKTQSLLKFCTLNSSAARTQSRLEPFIKYAKVQKNLLKPFRSTLRVTFNLNCSKVCFKLCSSTTANENSFCAVHKICKRLSKIFYFYLFKPFSSTLRVTFNLNCSKVCLKLCCSTTANENPGRLIKLGCLVL